MVPNANEKKTNQLQSSSGGLDNEMLAASLCSWYPMNTLKLLYRKIGSLGATYISCWISQITYSN